MSETLKIVTPTEAPGGLDSRRSAHFGHAPCFTVVDVVDGTITGSYVVTNPPHEQGGCGRVVMMLAREGVSAAIVEGMGRGPRSAMASTGIAAYRDALSPTPRDAVTALLAGDLPPFGDQHTCGGH